jgi:NADH dehydrogenase [ubiquinone] 1 alpha subcomplex assembly factor 5
MRTSLSRRFFSQIVFNARQKLSQRARASALPDAASFDYLRDEVASRLVGRLRDITRSFPSAADLGSNSGNVLSQLLSQRRPDGIAAGGVTRLAAVDPCAGMHARAAPAFAAAAAAGLAAVPLTAPLEGAPLPLEDASVDLVLSSMALHWVNDVPGVLEEVRRVLRPDGAFICAFLGGDTLQELRCVGSVCMCVRAHKPACALIHTPPHPALPHPTPPHRPRALRPAACAAARRSRSATAACRRACRP